MLTFISLIPCWPFPRAPKFSIIPTSSFHHICFFSCSMANKGLLDVKFGAETFSGLRVRPGGTQTWVLTNYSCTSPFSGKSTHEWSHFSKIHYLFLPVKQSETGRDKQMLGKQREKARQKSREGSGKGNRLFTFSVPFLMVFILSFWLLKSLTAFPLEWHLSPKYQ